MVSITLCQIMEKQRPKTVNPLVIFVLSVLLILFISNVSNIFYCGTGGYQFSAQHKISNGGCWFLKHCFGSWNIYGLKRGRPWNCFVPLYFINIISFKCCRQNLSWHRRKSIVCRTYSRTGEYKIVSDHVWDTT